MNAVSLKQGKPGKPVAEFARLLASLVFTAFATACALGTDSGGPPLVTTCTVPTDQSGTISGHWNVTPIPIALHQGDFQASEVSAITGAADTWNTFYTATQNLKTLDYGTDPSNPRVSTAAKPSALCASGIVQGSQFSGQVMVYKQGTWPYPNLPNAIALTSFCPLPATPIASFYMAIMEVNYQNFFVQGKKLPDLQSIFLHEFGHLHGLNHSCESFQKTGTPNCNDPNLNPDYLAASMFPVFGFDQLGNGEQKRSLASNDQGRANCLYTGTTAGTGTTGH